MRPTTQARAYEALPSIDLAPMLDFVVNLLVFFIITAVFAKQARVSVARPRATTAEEAEKPSKSIVIDAHGQIAIDGQNVDPRAVRAHVERFRAADPEAGIVVVAEREAPTGVVVGVIDEAHLGGIWNITFTTAQMTRAD